MPNRSWSAVSEYRFGFNGKEGDFETYGEGISYDFGARIYDTRLGRWMSVDPIWFNNAYLTPYHYVDNDPINNIDPNGLEIVEAGLRYGYGINKGNYKLDI
ncbi:MAG: hypothetical protein IPG60_07570 [Bacteroidetes bacterium]|nr:hypothetical protein [Bacteroidota bacterium]